MPKEQLRGTSRLGFGVIAAGLLGFAVYGLVTGDMSSGRSHADRAGHPLFYWFWIGLFAFTGGYSALVALGLAEMPASRISSPASFRRDTAQRLSFLALLASGGSAYAWWSERSIVSPSVMNEIMGWVALGALGLAVWPPVLPAGPVRTVARIAGTAAILIAAVCIVRIIR